MRPNQDKYGLELAKVVATRATCLRRKVGCVLVDVRGHVLATGYNGRASGLPHCDDFVWMRHPTGPDTKEYQCACAGVAARSGTDLDACEAIHAEQNALIQCTRPYEIVTCYCTVSPCISCVKMLMNTSCRRIVFAERYAHDEASSLLWSRGPGFEWRKG